MRHLIDRQILSARHKLATAVYGAGAPGGIVNLITRRATSEEFELDGVAQINFNPSDGSDTAQCDFYGGVGQKRDDWDWYGGLAYQDVSAAVSPEDTYVPRDEYQSWLQAAVSTPRSRAACR